MLSKDLMAEGRDQHRKAALASYNVHFVHADAPKNVRLERLLAPNLAAALNMADGLFPETTILRIHKALPRPRMDTYPDARFIKGAFLPVRNDDQSSQPSPAD
jgi:hypothetical protein